MSNQSKNQISGSSRVVVDVLFASVGIQPTESQQRRAGLVLDETIKMAQIVERELFIADQKILSRN